MLETITFHSLDLAGETGLKLYLRKNDGSLLNTGGDSFSDLGSAGVFTATLAESRVGLGTLAYRVCDGTETADNLVNDGFLPESSTVLGAEGVAVLNSADLRAAVGLADANIDEQFGDLMTAVTDVQTDVDANTGYLTALTTNMTTLLGRVTSQVYTMWTDLIAMITGSGSTPKFTTSALSNAPTGSGGSGGGQAPTIVTLQAVAGISPGVIVGPTEPLVIGDDYLTVMNRSVRINLLDENGNPAEVDYGTYALDDSGISIQLLLARSGKPSVEANIVGTCTFFPAEEVDDVLIPPYLIVEFTKVETGKAVPGAYDMQAEAVWQDGKVVTFAPYGQIQFVRDIRRA